MTKVNLEALLEVAARNKLLTEENAKLLNRATDAEDYVTALQDKFDKQELKIKVRDSYNRKLIDENKQLNKRIEELEEKLNTPAPAPDLETAIRELVNNEVQAMIVKERKAAWNNMHQERMMKW